jgi:hypothetical protein
MNDRRCDGCKLLISGTSASDLFFKGHEKIRCPRCGATWNRGEFYLLATGSRLLDGNPKAAELATKVAQEYNKKQKNGAFLEFCMALQNDPERFIEGLQEKGKAHAASQNDVASDVHGERG